MVIAWLLIFISWVNCNKTRGCARNILRRKECNFDIKKLPLNTPLLLDSRMAKVIYPKRGTTTITLQTGTAIYMACPGSDGIDIGHEIIENFAKLVCDYSWYFHVAGHYVDIGDVICEGRIKSAALATKKKCWGNGKEIEVVLKLYDDKNLKLYTVCFDYVMKNVLYSHYLLTKYIGSKVGEDTYPDWSEGEFYELDEKLYDIYKTSRARITINKQVGLPERDFKYIKQSGRYYLEKGPLTSKSDFVYTSQRMQTFRYINSAPQWETFLINNWDYLERNIRQYAADKFVDLEIYSGTYGILSFPHVITGAKINVYMYEDEDGSKTIPIPELFWKVIYDKVNKAGVAILGLNNPYKTDVLDSIICNDIADELGWLQMNRLMVDRGYIYACTIDDLRKSLPEIPDFDVQNILN